MQMTKKVDTLMVASHTDPAKLAGAIVAYIRENGRAELSGIGPSAINQMVKAIAVARGMVAPMGDDLTCVPSFQDVTIEGEERTAIRLVVTKAK